MISMEKNLPVKTEWIVCVNHRYDDLVSDFKCSTNISLAIGVFFRITQSFIQSLFLLFQFRLYQCMFGVVEWSSHKRPSKWRDLELVKFVDVGNNVELNAHTFEKQNDTHYSYDYNYSGKILYCVSLVVVAVWFRFVFSFRSSNTLSKSAFLVGQNI